MTDLIKIHEETGLLQANGNLVVFQPEIAARIADFEKQVKLVNEKEKALKEAILSEMERFGVTKLETPEVLINYIPKTDRESFDSKALREDFPDIYDTYCKVSPVKPTVRIRTR